jgi:hypothetical protein
VQVEDVGAGRQTATADELDQPGHRLAFVDGVDEERFGLGGEADGGGG